MKSLEQAVPFKRVSIKPELATSELWLEVKALARFWRRRCFFCFVPTDASNGETDWSIDHERLAFSLRKVAYYERLLSENQSSQGYEEP
jgi:hypothetical protein